MREAYERHDGVEVDTQGDAFFVAFPTAPGALAAAEDAQARLALPVRMGIHTGTPLLTREGYVGEDVHRAARIAAAGHGGQGLVFAAPAGLPPNAPPPAARGSRPRDTAVRCLAPQRPPHCSATTACATSASTGSRICPRPSGSTRS